MTVFLFFQWKLMDQLFKYKVKKFKNNKFFNKTILIHYVFDVAQIRAGGGRLGFTLLAY